MSFFNYFKILIILLLGISPRLKSSELESAWSQLLHIQGAKKSYIINSEFFLGNQTLEDELIKFQEIILKNNSESQRIACQFPARYVTLKKYQIDVPDIDLTLCSDLKKFLNNLKGKVLSLALTSEYFKAPSSAFGHVMLVLHEGDTILPSDKVIHFSAITNTSDGFFKYSYKGLTGAYPGYFILEPFFMKLHEYSNKEQRFLFFYSFDLKEEDIQLLKFHLYELDKAQFRYYFLNQNCSYQIDALLSLILGLEVTDNILYSLPVELIYKYNKYINRKNIIPPYSNKAMQIINKLDTDDQNNLKEIISNKKTLNTEHSNKLKQAYLYYALYRFNKDGISDENFSNNLKNAMILDDKLESSIDGPEKRNKPSYFLLGLEKEKNEHNLKLGFQPVLLDISTFQKNSLHESELKIFNIDLLLNKKNIYLDNFDIFSLKLLIPYTSFFDNFSWQFRTGFDRVNDQNVLKNNTYFGIGQSFEYGFILNYFINFGLGTAKAKFSPYISPEVNLLLYLKEDIKIGVGHEYRIHKSLKSGITSLFITYKIHINNELLIELSKFKDENIGASASYRYFF